MRSCLTLHACGDDVCVWVRHWEKDGWSRDLAREMANFFSIPSCFKHHQPSYPSLPEAHQPLSQPISSTILPPILSYTTPRTMSFIRNTLFGASARSVAPSSTTSLMARSFHKVSNVVRAALHLAAPVSISKIEIVSVERVAAASASPSAPASGAFAVAPFTPFVMCSYDVLLASTAAAAAASTFEWADESIVSDSIVESSSVTASFE